MTFVAYANCAAFVGLICVGWERSFLPGVFSTSVGFLIFLMEVFMKKILYVLFGGKSLKPAACSGF